MTLMPVVREVRRALITGRQVRLGVVIVMVCVAWAMVVRRNVLRGVGGGVGGLRSRLGRGAK